MCQLTCCSHAGQLKSFVHFQRIFGGLAYENVSWRVKMFLKHVQHSQNVWELCINRVGRVMTCDKILPHAGHVNATRLDGTAALDIYITSALLTADENWL